jgi:hypothetical protein
MFSDSNNKDFENNKKKILEDQEKDFAKDRESSEPLPLTADLKAGGIEMISYSKNYIYIETRNGLSLHTNLFKDNLSQTLEYLDKLVDGTFNDSLKKSIILFITRFWNEEITFDNGDHERNRDSQGQGKPAKAQLIIPAVKPHINKLFIDEYGIPHAGIVVGDHLEVLKLNTTRFKNWVRRTIYKENGSVVDNSTLNDIIGILSAEAQFNPECPTINLALRVANIDGSWYYDLTNKEWEFIKITPEGWYKVKNAIIFHRYNTTPQVDPFREYAPDIFDKFIDLFNIHGDKNRLLLKCYIISLFIPGIPKVILNLHGEEGAAKTTLQELIKMLVDPSPMKTSSFLRDTNEFVQQLAHNYVMAYDNISIIRDWISDLLCRVVTGSGFSKRELFTTDDDFIYTIMRCIMLNGITIAATKADLLDRSLIIQLEEIKKSKRRKVKDIWRDFDEIKAPLLGYIFDILVKVMLWKKENDSLGIQLSRMADWTEYSEIIARCMNHKENELIKAYNENEGLQLDEVLNSNPVAIVVIKYMANLAETEPKRLELKLTATK